MQEVLFTDVLFDAAFISSLITLIMFLLGHYVYKLDKTELIITSLFVFSFMAFVVVCCNYLSGFGMIVWFLFLITVLMLG